jgi:hypothetical protein
VHGQMRTILPLARTLLANFTEFSASARVRKRDPTLRDCIAWRLCCSRAAACRRWAALSSSATAVKGGGIIGHPGYQGWVPPLCARWVLDFRFLAVSVLDVQIPHGTPDLGTFPEICSLESFSPPVRS